MAGRVVFLDWIYDIASEGLFDSDDPTELQREIQAQVREAISRLSERDREFVQLYWFEGRPVHELAEMFGRRPHNIEGYNQQVLRKLQNLLTGFVKRRFRIDAKADESCILCSHPKRCDIDILLNSKRPEETFRRIYRELEERFDLSISTPQILIGHIKYHMLKEEDNE